MKEKPISAKELLSDENIYRKMIEEIEDYAIILLDLQGNVKSWNLGAERIKGYAREDVIGKNFRMFFLPGDRERSLPETVLAEAKEKGKVVMEGWRKKKDGTLIWVSSVLTALHEHETNTIIGFTKVVRDFTERKKAEDHSEFLSSIVRNVHDPIISISLDRSITDWNQPAEDVFGWKKEETIGKTVREILRPDLGPDGVDQVSKGLQEKGFWRGEIVFYSKKGEPVYTLLTASFLRKADETVTGIVMLMRDITERKNAEKALEKLNNELEIKVKQRTQEIFERDRRFQSLIENDYTITSLVSASNQTIYRSPSAQAILGWSEEERSNIPVETLIHPDDLDEQRKNWMEILNSPGRAISSVFRMKHKNSNYVWVESIAVNQLNDPYVQAVVLNMHDITERKKAEFVIKQMNETLEERVKQRTTELLAANKALESFSYMVSHDLQSPLRSLNSFTKIIVEKYSTDFNQELKDLFNYILTSGKRMNAIIEDLLKLAKFGNNTLSVSSINMTELFQKVWSNLTMNVVTPAQFELLPLPSIQGDVSMLEQVVINLVSNAIKYSSKVNQPTIKIGATTKNGETTFFVSDNGIGFNMDEYNKLFGAFQRLHSATDFEGTGIGLLLVKKIIENHGGTVWAESKENEGATFYFTLPQRKA